MTPPKGFYAVNSKGIVVASKYSRRKEFLAARSGAKGFLTKDITKSNLLRAIIYVSNGEIWMARVFEEHVK
tara:strand:- start:224 stop:436 length:213 start_codon:yes stop_codon:yes gene_type:complete